LMESLLFLFVGLLFLLFPSSFVSFLSSSFVIRSWDLARDFPKTYSFDDINYNNYYTLFVYIDFFVILMNS